MHKYYTMYRYIYIYIRCDALRPWEGEDMKEGENYWCLGLCEEDFEAHHEYEESQEKQHEL